MKILSFGAGMQSTALALMACENAQARKTGDKIPHPLVPIYCDYAIGFLTRGCIRKCPWCLVPIKEGALKPYRTWQQVARPDTSKITLLDNNILACEYGINQLAELAQTEYRIDLNQGMDARLVTPEIAEVLAAVKWQRFIRFSCDQKGQIDAVLNTIELLKKRGVNPSRIFIYLLVRPDVEDAAYRVEMMKKAGNITIYAQAERNEKLGVRPNKMQLKFANKYVYSGTFRKRTWAEYLEQSPDGKRR